MSHLNVALLVRRFPNIVQPYIFNQITTMHGSDVNIKIIAERIGTNAAHHMDRESSHPTNNPLYINTNFKNILRQTLSRATLNRKYIQGVYRIIYSHRWRQDGIKNLFRKLVFARILSFQKFDVIHSHSLFTTSNYLFLQQDFSIPIVTTYHGALPPGIDKLSDKRMSQVFGASTLFLVNTKSAKNDLVNLGCPLSKIKIIPQGINAEDFPFRKRVINDKNKIALLSVGRLSQEKNHATAIKSIAVLLNKFPNIEYHIVGDGPEKQALQKLITECELEEKIILHGFKTQSELTTFYATADIFILPSLNETQGLVLQEAQSSGLPVIASRTGGIPDVIQENITGLLFDPDNTSDLANKIENLIDSPELYTKLIIAARQDIEVRFNIKTICKDLVSIYIELTLKQNS